MNFKSLLSAVVLSIGLSVSLPAAASESIDPTYDLGIEHKRVFTLVDTTVYWYDVSSDAATFVDLLNMNVMGLMYYRDYDDTTGAVYVGGQVEELPQDFDVIFYLMDDGQDPSVHAINNHNGTVTMFPPGVYIP